MLYKTLIKGVEIPVLGLGSWMIGGGFIKDTSQDRESVAAIKAGIENNCTHIDTAEMYGEGHAEEIIGRAIEGIDRKKLFITTKVWRDNLSYNGILDAAKGSLKRLGIDYIDLYLIHWPNPLFPLKDSMKAMDSLVESGIVKYIGVSNFTVEQLKEAQSYAKNKIVAHQIEYNLLHREAEEDVIPCCRENDILIIAYRPIARGSLAQGNFDVLNDLAKKYKKTQIQVALNWLISQESVVAIPKAITKDHLEENLGALGWNLEEKDVQAINQEFQ